VFHQGSAKFWSNEFMVLCEVTSEVNIIDRICLMVSCEYNSQFFVFFKFAQVEQVVIEKGVSFSAHFVVLKLFDRRRHI